MARYLLENQRNRFVALILPKKKVEAHFIFLLCAKSSLKIGEKS